MSIPKRLQAKLFFSESSDVPAKAFIPVFHNWIEKQDMGDLLIDVHNYSHVHEGPGILLVAHESDYSVDFGKGRTGLVYRRKRSVPSDLNELFSLVIQRLAQGALRLESDDSLPGTLHFATDEIEVSVLDRLTFPNDDTVYGEFEPELLTAAEKVFGSGNVSLTRVDNDPREPLTIHMRLSDVSSLSDLEANLKATATG